MATPRGVYTDEEFAEKLKLISERNRKRTQGSGRLFLSRKSRCVYVGIPHHGREVRESSGSEDLAVAERLLRARQDEMAVERAGKGTFVGPQGERKTVGQLLDALVTSRTVAGKWSRAHVVHSKPVREHLGHLRAVDVTREVIDRYRLLRRRPSLNTPHGAANGTINRETSILSLVLGIGVRDYGIKPVQIGVLSERDAIRQGFVEPPEFWAIHAEIGDPDVADLLHFLWLTGWRVSEATKLTWGEVYAEAQELRLPGVRTKNRHGRELPYDLMPDLQALLERREAKRTVVVAGVARVSSHVFHRGGVPIRDFLKTWRVATAAAGHAGLVVHDLRRSAIRCMLQAGIHETTIMKITGHRTRSVFDRYAVSSTRDIAAALGQRARWEALTAQQSPRVVPMRAMGAESAPTAVQLAVSAGG